MNKVYKEFSDEVIAGGSGGATTCSKNTSDNKRSHCDSKSHLSAYRRTKLRHSRANSDKQRTIQRNHARLGKSSNGDGISHLSYISSQNIKDKIKVYERNARHCFSDQDLVHIFNDLEIEPHSDTEIFSDCVQDISGLNVTGDSNIDSFLESLSNIKDTIVNMDKNYSYIIDKLENVLAAAFLLTKAKSYPEIAAIILLFVKSNVHSSIIISTLEAVSSAVKAMSLPDSQSEDLSGYRYAIHNWKSFVKLTVFKQFSNLLSILVSIGLFPDQEIKIGELFTFNTNQIGKQLNTNDLFECVLDTFGYFCEFGYRLYTKKLGNFLNESEDKLLTLEKDVLHLKSYISHVTQGSYTTVTGNPLSFYQDMLIKTRNTLLTLCKTCRSDKTLYAIVQKKLESVSLIEVSFEGSRLFCSQREAPYCINLFGGSSRGKSSLAQILSVCILKHNNIPHTDDCFCTIQPDDKYYSTYRANTTCVILDDVANTVTDKANVNPADRIIMIKNNVSYFAPKADVADKGKIAVNPSLLTITTNVKDLNAHDWSQEPVSVVRRFDCIITAKVRPIFATNGLLDYNKVLLWSSIDPETDPYKSTSAIPDLWLLTVEKATITQPTFEGGKEGFSFVPIVYKDRQLIDVNIYDVIEFLQQDSTKFYNSQKELLKKVKNLGEKIDFCTECGCLKMRCTCPKKDSEEALETQSGYIQDKCESALHYVIWSYLRSKYKQFIHKYPFFMNLLNTCIVCLFYFLARFHWAFVLPCWIILYLYMISPLWRVASFNNMIDNLVDTVEDNLHELQRKAISKYRADTLIYGTLSLAVAYSILKCVSSMYKAFQARRIQAHGNLCPTIEDINSRDKEVNIWKHVSMDLPRNENTNTYTSEQLCNVIARNSVNITLFTEETMSKTCAIFVKSNILMIPKHLLFNSQTQSKFSTFKLRVLRGLESVGGSSFTENVEDSQIFEIPDHDLALVRLVKGGTWRDITSYYSDVLFYSPSTLIYRDTDGIVQRKPASCQQSECSYMINGKRHTYQGGKCIYDIDTYKGLCMAAHISQSTAPSILGHHIAGFTGRKEGRFAFISRSVLQESCLKFTSSSKILEVHSGGDFSLDRFDTIIPFSSEVSEKAPISFIGDFDLKLYGTIGSQSTYHSEVVRTYFSDSVEKHLGIANRWGKPKFKPTWAPWYNTLVYLAGSAGDIADSLLERSVDDYISPLLALLDEYKKYDIVRPLTDSEIINGIHGKRFIDSFNYKSGIGYPLKGSKSEYVIGLPGFKEWDPLKKDKLMSEINIAICKYKSGIRYYPIFKACLKDEPTLIGKDKVRVFMASDFVLQYLWRKYTLPILRFLSMYPLVSEIAVGINCFSDEWEQLINHVTMNGELNSTMVAGDYSKWDLRLPIKVILYSLSVIIKLAENLPDYTPEDIVIMKGLATDTAYYVCHYNGSLFEMNGGMASGHSLTAHLNSICNALLLRSYFYSYSDHKLEFRDYVKTTFYGDDFMAGVTNNSGFTFKGYQSFLSTYEIVLTMPDKESEAVDYMNIQDVDFLKRRSVFIPELGYSIGALSVDSLYKSLHTRTKLSCSKEMHAISVMGCFMNEAFAHGRSFYDQSLRQLGDVARDAGVVVPALHVDFDTMADNISKKQTEEDSEIPAVTSSDYSMYDSAYEEAKIC